MWALLAIVGGCEFIHLAVVAPRLDVRLAPLGSAPSRSHNSSILAPHSLLTPHAGTILARCAPHPRPTPALAPPRAARLPHNPALGLPSHTLPSLTLVFLTPHPYALSISAGRLVWLRARQLQLRPLQDGLALAARGTSARALTPLLLGEAHSTFYCTLTRTAKWACGLGEVCSHGGRVSAGRAEERQAGDARLLRPRDAVGARL